MPGKSNKSAKGVGYAMPDDQHGKFAWVAELLNIVCDEAYDVDGDGRVAAFPGIEREVREALIGDLYAAIHWNNGIIKDPSVRKKRQVARLAVRESTGQSLGQILRALRQGLSQGIPFPYRYVEKGRSASAILRGAWRLGTELSEADNVPNPSAPTTARSGAVSGGGPVQGIVPVPAAPNEATPDDRNGGDSDAPRRRFEESSPDALQRIRNGLALLKNTFRAVKPSRELYGYGRWRDWKGRSYNRSYALRDPQETTPHWAGTGPTPWGVIPSV